MSAPFVIEGYGMVDVRGFKEDEAPMVCVDLPSLQRSDRSQHTWQMVLFPDEALKLLSLLADGLRDAQR
jgi:hypothetical protein